MTNLAHLLKNEIARVARKELRAQTAGMKKTVAAYRTEIAALKRRIAELEQAQRQLRRQRAGPVTDGGSAQAKRLRFNPKGLATQRRRLGLSAHDCGLLLGASGQSVYNWEEGKARPRAAHLEAIAALRGLGKKEAARRLVAQREAASG